MGAVFVTNPGSKLKYDVTTEKNEAQENAEGSYER